MLDFVLLFMMCASLAKTQEGEIIIPDNKTVCITDMIEWCESMKYPQQGAGLAVLSVVYEDPSGYYRVLCSSDSEGTNCTRNQLPWFACSPDHVLSYKEQILTNETSKEDVDDDICKTADKAFNELFVQNLSYNNISLKNEVQSGMEAFFDQIAKMEDEIDWIKRFLRAISYIGNVWNLIDEERDIEESELEEREFGERKNDFPSLLNKNTQLQEKVNNFSPVSNKNRIMIPLQDNDNDNQDNHIQENEYDFPSVLSKNSQLQENENYFPSVSNEDAQLQEKENYFPSVSNEDVQLQEKENDFPSVSNRNTQLQEKENDFPSISNRNTQLQEKKNVFPSVSNKDTQFQEKESDFPAVPNSKPQTTTDQANQNEKE